jgi:hypothetical protein
LDVIAYFPIHFKLHFSSMPQHLKANTYSPSLETPATTTVAAKEVTTATVAQDKLADKLVGMTAMAPVETQIRMAAEM